MGTDPDSRYELDLIRLQIQGFTTSWDFYKSIPIYSPPIVSLNVGAELTPYIRPTVLGYDLTGLGGLIETGELSSLADGFYVLGEEPGFSLSPNGPQYEGAGAEIRMEVGGGVSVSIGPLGVYGDAAIIGDLEIELNDPNDDGRVRFQELFDNFSYNPLAVFDASLRVALQAEIGVKLDLLFFTKKFAIYRTPEFELFRLDIEGGAPPQPYYATAPDGGSTLLLNIGARADQRNLDPNDNSEVFTLQGGSNMNVRGPGGQTEGFRVSP